jgi:hypothetical protein
LRSGDKGVCVFPRFQVAVGKLRSSPTNDRKQSA